jgi:hypothetical protein
MANQLTAEERKQILKQSDYFRENTVYFGKEGQEKNERDN